MAEPLPAIRFESVDIVFGDRPKRALPLIDAGASREEILERTGQVVGVAGASLEVGEGRICVLMGLSGSGKSTLLRAVNGLNPVTRGRVLVREGDVQVDVVSCDRATLRRLRMRRIAMVFQQFALLPWRTVAENVALGLELRGMPRKQRERIVREKLELVHLEAWADKPVHELSGGMQQRVGLARALATDADILLMDEPFSALDPLIRQRLQDELLELQRRLGKTILFVSHDLDEALKLGSTIAILEGGRVVQTGRPEEIIRAPANDYVRSFVANVNPLAVLSLGAAMRPLAVHGPEVALGDGLILETDAAARPIRVRRGATILTPVREPERLNAPNCILLAPATAAIRLAVEALERNPLPVVVISESGAVVGCVGVRELLASIKRRDAVGSGQSQREVSSVPQGWPTHIGIPSP